MQMADGAAIVSGFVASGFVVQAFTIDEISPMSRPSKSFEFNILGWPADCSLSGTPRPSMMKIQRSGDPDVVFTVSGRLVVDNISELSALLAAEASGRSLVLDLKDVVLVDRDAVRFLRTLERGGITLRNCPPYIREWIAREEDQP